MERRRTQRHPLSRGSTPHSNDLDRGARIVGWVLLFILVWVLLPATTAHGQDGCIPTATHLCLNEGRFAVEVEWRDFQDNTGRGHAVFFGADDSGLLWFFDVENWELLVKVIDGCPVNGHFWVFAAATTNVEYRLVVTDTSTGQTQEYFNPLGRSADAITDTSAFATCTPEQVANPPSLATAEPPPGFSAGTTTPAPQQTGPCATGPATLCLEDDRFRVEVDWTDFSGTTGPGRIAPVSSDDSGLFWFFAEDNWEMLVKVIDGCTVNDRFWVFAAATTNVGYTLRVTDTWTGATQEYRNPVGTAAPAITDASAFPTCAAEDPQETVVRFLSDQSVLLGGERTEALLEVEVVDGQNQPIPDATVEWTSESPSVVSVTPEGPRSARVRALGSPPASVTVTARSGLAEGRATVALSTPGPDTVLLDSRRVLSRTATEVVLERTSTTEALSPSQILVTGDQAGVLLRIQSVALEPNRVRIEGTSTSLPAAFQSLRVDARGQDLDLQVRLDNSGGVATLYDHHDRLLARQVIQGVECKLEGSGQPVAVQVQGGSVDFSFRLRPRILVDIDSFSLEELRAQLTSTLRMSATTGAVTFGSSLAAEAECTLELPSLELPSIPASVFSFTFKLIPAVGVQASATFTGPSLTVSGPAGRARGSATGGIRYTSSAGWSLISRRSWNGELQLFAIETDFDQEFEATAGPFVQLEAGVDVDLGRGIFSLNLADFRFLELEGSGAADLKMSSPLLPREPAYVGPEWELSLQAKGDLKAELAGGALADLLDKLGIDTNFGGPLNLFTFDLSLLKSPKPKSITASDLPTDCSGLAALKAGSGDSVDFEVRGDDASGDTDLWSSPGGNPPLVVRASGPYGDGLGQASWSPQAGDEGKHRFFPRLAVDPISRVVPYAAGGDVFVEVAVTGQEGTPEILSIDPRVLELDHGDTAELKVMFRDPDAGIDRVTGEVVAEDCPEGCDSGFNDFNPNVLEKFKGMFPLPASCVNTGSEPFSVTFEIRLNDCQGNVSEPEQFTVVCTPPVFTPRQRGESRLILGSVSGRE